MSEGLQGHAVHWLQGCLATWTEKETALVLLRQLLLGFELDVYAEHEYCYLYWYVIRLPWKEEGKISLLVQLGTGARLLPPLW